MPPQPSITVDGLYGAGIRSMSSRRFSAIAGGTLPEWISRMSRSTSESLEKFTPTSGTTRKTWRFWRLSPVPIAVWMVMVFIKISTWQ